MNRKYREFYSGIRMDFSGIAGHTHNAFRDSFEMDENKIHFFRFYFELDCHSTYCFRSNLALNSPFPCFSFCCFADQSAFDENCNYFLNFYCFVFVPRTIYWIWIFAFDCSRCCNRKKQRQRQKNALDCRLLHNKVDL